MTVVVVGSVNVDTKIAVDRLPGPGETVRGQATDRRGGGKGANVAYAAAATTRDVILVAQVGSDPDAELALSGLEGAGVSLQHVRRCATATGTAMILVDSAGENCIVVDPGANFAWSGTEVAAELETTPLEGAVVVTNFEVPESVCLAAGRAAAASGATFVLNPSPLRALTSELVECAPLLVTNGPEVAALVRMVGIRTDDPELAARAIEEATGAPVVVTLGPDGAGVQDGGWTVVPGRRVAAVDTTGAGDAFLGTMTALMTRGRLQDAVRAGTEYAAQVVRSNGARLQQPPGTE